MTFKINISLLYLTGITCFCILAGCSPVLKTGKGVNSISRIQLLNIYELPPAMQFKGTTVGGLSGIDHDQKNDLYYLICDDRSDINPSRFYTAKIQISSKGIDTVILVDATTLINKDRKPYTNYKEDPYRRTDPEGIRYNPVTDELVWSNEGEKAVLNGKMTLCDPSVTVINKQGQYKDSFLLPTNLHVDAADRGVRRNGGFEGLSFDDEYKFLYISVEEPLYEDGPRAGFADSTAWIRIAKFDAVTKKQVAQYAYKVDAVPYAANPIGAYKINGVPEILYVGKNKLLVIERAFSTGRNPCAVRIYIAELTGATDVATINSLQKENSYKPIGKKLLLNMEDLGRYIDNVEGVTFGPKLPNGNQTLMFVSDDNFSATQKTQFFLFEITR